MTLLLALSLQSATIKLDLTPGTFRTYEVTRDYKAVAEDEQMTFVQTVTHTVQKDKDEGRAKLTVAYTLRKTVLDGRAFPTKPDEKPLVRTEQRLPNGQVFLRELFPNEGVVLERQGRVCDIRFLSEPIKLGSTWGRDTAGELGDGFPAAHWDWTCTAIDDKTATLNLKFSERECPVPITAEGTLVVDLKSGWYESVDVTIRNTVTPGDTESVLVVLKTVWKKV